MKIILSFFFISIVVDIAASVCFAQQSRLGQAPAVHVEASGDEPVNRANTTSSATPCWYDTSNRGVVANAYNSLSASGLDPDGADGEFQSAGRWNHFRRLPGRSPKRHQLGSGHGRRPLHYGAGSDGVSGRSAGGVHDDDQRPTQPFPPEYVAQLDAGRSRRRRKIEPMPGVR